MFCSSCGKRINSGTNICSNCGTENEPLKGLKKLDSNIMLTTNPTQKTSRQTDTIQEVETKIVYRDSPKKTNIIYRWRVLAAILFVLLVGVCVLAGMNINSNTTRISDQVEQIQKLQDIQSNSMAYSKEKYDFVGTLNRNEYGQYFIELSEIKDFEINDEQYQPTMIYFSPSTEIPQNYQVGEDITANGNICKLDNNNFMVVAVKFYTEDKSATASIKKEE